jgi:hypothetical protein
MARKSPEKRSREQKIEAERKRYEKLIETADPELLRKIVDRIFTETGSDVYFGLQGMYYSEEEHARDEARLVAREDIYDLIKSMLGGKDKDI